MATERATVLRARARLRAGKASGPDGLGAEILRELPWRTVRALVVFFSSVFLVSVYPLGVGVRLSLR